MYGIAVRLSMSSNQPLAAHVTGFAAPRKVYASLKSLRRDGNLSYVGRKVGAL